MSILLDPDAPKLFSILASIPGKKSLILDKSLSVLISSLASFSELQEHGIESVKWLQQTKTMNGTAPARVLIIVRPEAEHIQAVASLVKATQSKDFTLILLPRRTLQADQILEEEGVLADVNIATLPIVYTQEDTDVIKVHVPEVSYSWPIVHPTELYNIANALVELEKQYGAFSKILGKGANAEKLSKLLSQGESELLIEEQFEMEPNGLLGECVVLDREVDLLTPLLTQLTYEGLLHENYPLAGSVLELPSSIQSQERKITLGPGDAIFTDLRGENFSNVGPKLSGTASSLSTELDSRHNLKTTTQLKAFVSRIPNLQSSQKLLKIHIELTELLLAKTKTGEFRHVLEIEQSLYGSFSEAEMMVEIESVMAQEYPLSQVLRLLCIWSIVHNGLKLKDYETMVTRVLQCYGYENILVLHRLRQHGLFIVRTAATEKGRGGWTGFSRSWKLCPDEVEERNPVDTAYLYSGYSPLNLRILQGYLQPTFFDVQATSAAAKIIGGTTTRAFENMLRNLRGPTVEVHKHPESKYKEEKVLLVVFLGGCTATELAGVRLIAKLTGREALVVTRGFVNGGELVKTFME